MPYLPDTVIRLPIGATGLSFNGPEVIRDDPARAGVTYDYHWYIAGTTTPADLPGTLAIRRNRDGTEQRTARITNRLVGNAPTSAEYGIFICQASVSAQQVVAGTDDPDAPYRAQVTFITGAAEPEADKLATGFNGLSFRNADRFRIGVAHDNPNNLYLFMGLPLYAPSGQGPVNQGGGTSGQQWLPIENIQEFIPPRITSNSVEAKIESGPYITVDDMDHISENPLPRIGSPGVKPSLAAVPPTQGRGHYRTQVKYGAASLRLLWKESYASHGGPFGLYQAAVNGALYIPFAYYQRDIDTPARGKVLRSWTGFVAEFVETMTRQGRFVDIVILSSAASRNEIAIPSASTDTVASILWPEGTGA